MNIGFVYAGQGSQAVGMGRSLYDGFAVAREVFDGAALDFDFKALCFDGPAEILNQTAFTQPCMAAVAIAVTRVLAEQGIVPCMAAGLSLGEYSALAAAGVFGAQTALELLRFRGQAMERAVADAGGKMAAVLGLDRDALQAACDEAGKDGLVQIANYNCPGQMVIGGVAAAVDRACAAALERGARRAVPLNVSGPFHTALMAPAARELEKRLMGMELPAPRIPVVFNATASTLQPGETVAGLLVRQMTSPVYFEDSVRAMERAGVDTVIEIGPGKVLSGFIRRTCPGLTVLQVEDAVSVKAAVSVIKHKEAGA